MAVLLEKRGWTLTRDPHGDFWIRDPRGRTRWMGVADETRRAWAERMFRQIVPRWGMTGLHGFGAVEGLAELF